MERGYFPVFRKIFDSDVWAHSTARIVWIYILGNVSYEPSKTCERFQCIELEPGQMIIGRKAGAEKCLISEQSFRTALEYLKSTNRITIKSTKRFSIITVINWQHYRDAQFGINQENNQQVNQEVTINQPTANHIKEVKKLRKIKTYSVGFQNFWSAYPKSVGKQVAYEKWESALKETGVTEEHIIRAAAEYATQCEDRKTEDRYILNPATFLFKDRWKDYCFKEET